MRRNAAAALLAGFALPLSFAPFGFLPIFYLTYAAFFFLLLRVEARGARAVMLIGWCFGFGQFFVGLYWLGAAFLVDAKSFGWLLPFAVTLLPAGLALFFAAAAGGWYRLCQWRGLAPAAPMSALVLGFCVAFTEYLRGTILSGLPWNLPAMAWADAWLMGGALAQGAYLVGVYGLSLAALISALGFAVWLHDRRHWGALAAFIAPLLLAAGLGAHLLARPALAQSAPRILVVQPNIDQTLKWRPENRAAIIETTFALTRSALRQTSVPTIVVWPETALPLLVDETPAFAAWVAAVLRAGDFLILGSVRRDAGRVYNSAFVYDAVGQVRAYSDKYHLVPFGEYMPLRAGFQWLGLGALTGGNFSAGADNPRLVAAGLPMAAPLICYESIFPFTLGAPRPRWLVSLTNDGWFGATLGPHQHLAQARLRTIEQGLPMARAANTGISAVIDSHGRILARQPLQAQGVLSIELPPARAAGLFARYGNWIFFALMAVYGLVLLARPKT